MKHPTVIGIAGWSGSGKTTLLAYVIAHLSAQGLQVNVIKHSHHRIGPDVPEKDSVRLRDAGASSVLVSSSFPSLPTPNAGLQAEPSLSDLLNRMPASDLVLVEGFKKEPIPKVEIYSSQLGMPALYPDDVNVIAVASDTAPPADITRRTWLDINRPAQVLAWLQIYMDCRLEQSRVFYERINRPSCPAR